MAFAVFPQAGSEENWLAVFKTYCIMYRAPLRKSGSYRWQPDHPGNGHLENSKNLMLLVQGSFSSTNDGGEGCYPLLVGVARSLKGTSHDQAFPNDAEHH
jgi:hypothetical protein